MLGVWKYSILRCFCATAVIDIRGLQGRWLSALRGSPATVERPPASSQVSGAILCSQLEACSQRSGSGWPQPQAEWAGSRGPSGTVSMSAHSRAPGTQAAPRLSLAMH